MLIWNEQAIKMYLDPLKYQHWLLGMFLEEEQKFIDKHYSLLKELGYRME